MKFLRDVAHIKLIFSSLQNYAGIYDLCNYNIQITDLKMNLSNNCGNAVYKHIK